MTFRRRFLARLALVLLVALPLRSMASIEMFASGDRHVVTVVAGQAMPGDCGMPASHDATQDSHGTCSGCCCVAVILTAASPWQTAHHGSPAPLAPAVPAAPAVVPDGLERPPRTFPA